MTNKITTATLRIQTGHSENEKDFKVMMEFDPPVSPMDEVKELPMSHLILLDLYKQYLMEMAVRDEDTVKVTLDEEPYNILEDDTLPTTVH